MGAAAIVTLLTSVLTGIAKVTGVTKDALTKSLEQMLESARDGKLLPEELLAQVTEDAERLDSIRENLPD